MNSAIAYGRWEQLKGAVTAQWGHVTGDPLSVIAGRHRQRVGELRAATGAASDQIAREFERIQRRSVRSGHGA